MNDDGFLAALLFIGVLVIAGVSGSAYTLRNIEYDCINYGKTQIFTAWYECKPAAK